MVNNGANPHHIPIVNPLAQLIILPCMAAIFHEVPRLSTASRGVMTVEGPLPSSAPPPLTPLTHLPPMLISVFPMGVTDPPLGHKVL